MISGIVDIKMSAHVAAQKCARMLSSNDYGTTHSRKEQLDWLEEAGHGRFLLKGGHVAPIASGAREDDESCVSWALYSLSEIKAVDAAFEMEIFQKLPETPENRECSCGGYIEHPQSLNGQPERPDHCQDCSAIYAKDPEKLVHESIISACGWGFGHYGGPGRSFSHSAHVEIVRDHVLIKQFSGLDI